MVEPGATSAILRSDAGQWFIDRNGNRQWDGCVADGCYSGFGQAGDLPAAGDWNGAGFAKIGVFRNGQWYLDANNNGQWEGCSVDLCLNFGQAGDLPVAGNWNGGVLAGVGVFRAGTWYLDYSGNGKWDGCQQDGGQDKCFYNSFGQAGDLPAAATGTATARPRLACSGPGPGISITTATASGMVAALIAAMWAASVKLAIGRSPGSGEWLCSRCIKEGRYTNKVAYRSKVDQMASRIFNPIHDYRIRGYVMHTQSSINPICNQFNERVAKNQLIAGAFLLICVSTPVLANTPISPPWSRHRTLKDKSCLCRRLSAPEPQRFTVMAIPQRKSNCCWR
ncbi:MAG: hypothetical protein HC889_19885 [Synechococcaceae cyanobacterium SM1_2_3]|nr:hypothetical protein [Synechococcaceae cyanobacterium SM1_2_3]